VNVRRATLFVLSVAAAIVRKEDRECLPAFAARRTNAALNSLKGDSQPIDHCEK